MNKKLSYVYQHRDVYKAILELLQEKSETTPGLNVAIDSIKQILSECDWFEQWRVDRDYFTHLWFTWDEMHALFVTKIPNQSNVSGYITPNEEMLVIDHNTGPFIFGDGSFDDYPVDFFDKFYEEVKTACPPDYEDKRNCVLYYKRTRAAEACKSYYEIREKYNTLNDERKKKLRIELLEKELAIAKEAAK